MIVIDYLINSIRKSSNFNPDVQVAPVCILWTDHEFHWEAIIPRLQNQMPELFVLGDYYPEKKTGPAIWLRCIISGTVEGIEIENKIPILYLPGVSRQDLRAVETCPDHLKPLIELQHRGVIWFQVNGKDWTILAFLKSDQGGLGLDVSQDNDTKNAMQLALYRLVDEEVEFLRGKRLDKDYFNTLLTGGDPTRDLLQWLDQGEAFRTARPDAEWKAFIEICKSQFAFDPENDGILVGAEKLATHKGPWEPVWERFCEAPNRYINIPTQIRKCNAPKDTLLWKMGETSFDGWPQWNEDQENNLCQELKNLAKIPSHQARKRILELEKHHGTRRKLVWAEIGESSLALSLEFLSTISQITSNPLAGNNIDDLTTVYQSSGWCADDGVLKALACARSQSDYETINIAIQACYKSWIEDSARLLQKLVSETGYPGGDINNKKVLSFNDGDCLLFVDGLRFDIAKRLIELLSEKNCLIEEKFVWAALPTVTGTGKPATTPVLDKIIGHEGNIDFEPCVKESGKSLKGGYHIKKLIIESGWKFLEKSETGDGKGKAWCEFGDIDNEGHTRGWKLAKHIENILLEIRERIMELFFAGWKTIRIVTDHGWLLLPGGLPKIDLPSALTENKWGRCAVVKPGAQTDEWLFPWFWNPTQFFALADGISCFRKGEEYAHGGLSFQECFTIEMTVTPPPVKKTLFTPEFTNVAWRGLRCTVAVDGEFTGLSIDIRKQPGNSSSSIIVSTKPLKSNGTASVVVENEDLEGSRATIVLFDANDELIAQRTTLIGGGDK